MVEDDTDDDSATRRRFLEMTFTLARSRDHADHRTIYAELERHDDYELVRFNFESPAVRKQVDRICAETLLEVG